MFSQYFPPEVGATQIRLEVFARTLADAGHDVTVIAEVPNHPSGTIPPEWRGRFVHRTAEQGYEVLRVWVYTSPRKSFWRRLAFYLTYSINAIVVALTMIRRRPDVVFASSPPLPVLTSALVTATLWHRPFVIDIRDLWPAIGVALDELRGRRAVRLAQALERLLYRRAAAVVCVTQGFVEHVVAEGAAPSKVHLLPNGTLPDVFRPDCHDSMLRSRLGLGQDAFVVGYVGLHGIAQGLHALLDAAALLGDEPGIRFLFVGDGPIKGELIAAAAARGLDNVVFADQVAVEAAPKFINACDVMVVPLRRLNLLQTFVPSKIFDYLACAKPVVIMADGEARRLVEESGTGVFVEPEDPYGLARAVVSLRNDPTALKAMGALARPFVCRSFDRQKIAPRLERILVDVAARNDPGGPQTGH